MLAELRSLLSHSAIRFALTGILNTCVGLGIVYALKWLLDVSDGWANFIGYCVGFCVSCVVNARWTFGYREKMLAVAPGYALVVMAAYLINLACVFFCINALEMNSYLAQACGVPPYALFTYFVSRRFVFRNRHQ